MRKTFCAEDQKDIPKQHGGCNCEKKAKIAELTDAKILDALREQQDTLQDIERILQRIERYVSPDYVFEAARKKNEEHRRKNGASAFGI